MKEDILTPEGIMMLLVAVVFDAAGVICAILVLAAGVGAILGKIVYFLALFIIGGWQFMRTGSFTGKKGKGTGEVMKKLAKKFFKKHWKKLATKFIPVIGDLLPMWTWTVYSELTSS